MKNIVLIEKGGIEAKIIYNGGNYEVWMDEIFQDELDTIDKAVIVARELIQCVIMNLT